MKRICAVFAALLLLVSAGGGSAKNIKNTTVTISLGSDLETMDPHTNTSALTTTLHRYVFDTLMHRPNGTDLLPWAAKSFKQIDPKTLEFHMREGVTFSNGEEVDAQAVRYSLMRVQKKTMGFLTSSLLLLLLPCQVIFSLCSLFYLFCYILLWTYLFGCVFIYYEFLF